MRLSGTIVGSLFGMLVAGCGAPDEFGSDEELGNGEDTSSVASELVAGAGIGVTERVSYQSAAWPTTAWQSETGGATLDDFEYIAYNAEDTNTSHVTYPQRSDVDSLGRPYVDRIVCPGTSLMGRSMWDPTDEDGWTSNRLPVPSGMAMLWGDPAVAVGDGKWWVSALASPTEHFNNRANVTHNGQACFRNSNFAGSGLPSGMGSPTSTTPLGAACVVGMHLESMTTATSTCFRRSNGVHSSTGTDFLDGGSMAICSGAIYAAYYDVNSTTVAMYRRPTGGSWAAVSGDNGITTNHHPVLLSSTSHSGIWMLTANGSTITLRTHSAANGFGTSQTVTNDFSKANITVKGGRLIRAGRAIAGVVAPNPSMLSPAIWVAYERQSSSQNGSVTKRQIVLKKCTSGGCTLVNTFGGVDPLSGTGYNAFQPALALAYKLVNGTPVPVIGMTYWVDDGQANHKVVMRQIAYNTNTTIRSGANAITAAQSVCPGNGSNYWSDYDGMFVKNNATTAPTFHRSFTDSSETTCDTTTRANLDYRSQNQHVSNVYYVVP